MKRIYSILLVLLAFSDADAQHLQQSNFTYQNPIFSNPAFAGVDYNFDVIAGQRLQWVGVNGAPATTYVSANAYMDKNMGLGGNIILDRSFMYNSLTAKFAYAYHLELGNESVLSLALAPGFYQNSLNPDGAIATDYTDQALQKTMGGTGFDADFGLAYVSENLRIGAAVSHLLQSRVKYTPDALIEGFGHRRQMNFFASMDIETTGNISVTPMAEMRLALGANMQIDIGAIVTYDNTFWGSLSLRQGNGVVIGMGTTYDEKFLVGYSYEIPMFGIQRYSAGSHEIYLGYRIKSNYKSFEGSSRKVGGRI
jgi:type IX secretion system PorP/SprF family membrane protein